jgi:hypothetical protein
MFLQGAKHRKPVTDHSVGAFLLVAAEETSLGYVERLEHEYALKAELDADWLVRPVALVPYNDCITLVLEDRLLPQRRTSALQAHPSPIRISRTDIS